MQAAGNQNGVVWLAIASPKSTNNYQNWADGRVSSSNHAALFDISGYVGLNKRWGYTRLYFLRTEQRFNIINGTRDARTGHFTTQTLLPDGSASDRPISDDELNSRVFLPYNSQHLTNGKLLLNNLLQVKNGGSLTLNLSYARNNRDEFADVARPFQAQLGLLLHTNYYDVRYNLPSFCPSSPPPLGNATAPEPRPMGNRFRNRYATLPTRPGAAWASSTWAAM